MNIYTLCGLDSTHFGMYNCSVIRNTDRDTTGYCNSAVSVAANLFVFFVALLLVVNWI